MLKIGEFSKLTQVSTRMLRYYDEEGLLKPAETDPVTGYRLYCVDQIPRLNKILYLRDVGFQVAEIGEALEDWREEEIVRRLDDRYREIQKTIREEEQKQRKIELAKRELLRGKTQMHHQVNIKAVPGRLVLSRREVLPDYYAEGRVWQELAAFAGREKAAVSNESFSIYHDPEYKEKDVDVEVCVPVEKAGRDKEGFVYRYTEAVPLMACTMVYGAFHNIAGAYLSFAEWLQTNVQYQMRGPNRQIVHRGPWNEKDPEKYLVEIQIPLVNA